MTDSSYADITFICDRSGSMSGAADGSYTKAQRSTDGVARIVAEQKALPGKTRFSLLEFDTLFAWHAREAENLTWTCQPRGSTALLDAVGQAITETGERLKAMPEDKRPGRVFIVIATDGYENSSHEFSKSAIAAMVKEQTEVYKWDFAFVGVDINAFAEAGGMGIPKFSTMNSAADVYAVAMASTGEAMTRSRVSGQSFSYSDDDRKKVRDAKDKPAK